MEDSADPMPDAATWTPRLGWHDSAELACVMYGDGYEFLGFDMDYSNISWPPEEWGVYNPADEDDPEDYEDE